MAAGTEPSLLQVINREGSRRDAILVCALCDTRTSLHFYEPPGTPVLDGSLLWMFHFDKCPVVNSDSPIGLRLMWDVPGRDTENLELDPKSRKLKPKA